MEWERHGSKWKDGKILMGLGGPVSIGLHWIPLWKFVLKLLFNIFIGAQSHRSIGPSPRIIQGQRLSGITLNAAAVTLNGKAKAGWGWVRPKALYLGRRRVVAAPPCASR